MSTTSQGSELKGIKCMNALYMGVPPNQDFDLHFIKYNKYHHDGKTERCVALKKNFEKTFWVVKDAYRTFQQKRERILKEKCDEYKVPNHQVPDTIRRALGIKFGGPRDHELLKHHYVMGTDYKSEAELKYKFNQHPLSKGFDVLADVAVFDVETNIKDKSKYNHITMATLSFKEKVITAIHWDYFQGKFTGTKEQALAKLYELDNHYLERVNKERNIQQEFVIVDTEWEILERVFARAHEWKPDFITAWNMTYDIERMMEAADRARRDLGDLLSDPIVPYPMRTFKFFPGRSEFISSKGVRKNLSIEEKWPFVTCPSSWVWIDAMCLYNKSRVHKGKLPSYKLGYILGVEFPEKANDPKKDKSYVRKMTFTEAEQYSSDTPDWHIYMSEKFPFHYCIYNKFDCVSIEYLDEQTKDIANVLTSACEFSNYEAFDSEPGRLVDGMHWEVQEKNYCFGTGGGTLKNPIDDLCISKSDWIITLRADLWVNHGLPIIAESPNMQTRMSIHNADADAVSSYPNSGSAMNTSRETTTKELISIQGVDEFQRRMQGINLMGGFVNSVEFCEKIYAAAPLTTIVKKYREKNGIEHTNRLM